MAADRKGVCVMRYGWIFLGVIFLPWFLAGCGKGVRQRPSSGSASQEREIAPHAVTEFPNKGMTKKLSPEERAEVSLAYWEKTHLAIKPVDALFLVQVASSTEDGKEFVGRLDIAPILRKMANDLEKVSAVGADEEMVNWAYNVAKLAREFAGYKGALGAYKHISLPDMNKLLKGDFTSIFDIVEKMNSPFDKRDALLAIRKRLAAVLSARHAVEFRISDADTCPIISKTHPDQGTPAFMKRDITDLPGIIEDWNSEEVIPVPESPFVPGDILIRYNNTGVGEDKDVKRGRVAKWLPKGGPSSINKITIWRAGKGVLKISVKGDKAVLWIRSTGLS
jgi:hypothetical protein